MHPNRRPANTFAATACALTLLALFSAVAVRPAQAQTVSTVYSFSNGSNPNSPVGVMAQGRNGSFYGVTQAGGTANTGDIYSISPAGVFTNLYSTTQTSGNNCTGLTLGTDGNFYGTCANGGTNDTGTIFKVTPAGTVTVLHNFAAEETTTDGCFPYSPPIQGTNGDLYGFATSCGEGLAGMAYKITLAGVYTQLYSFQGGPTDVDSPYGAPLQASDGDIWGTGVGGGSVDGNGGVFKLTTAGKETLVYSFQGQDIDGSSPYAPLIEGTDGNFYGTTFLGGLNVNDGTVFKLTPAGKETVLYSFPNQTDGAFPRQPLTQGTNGLLYGVATDCGGGGCSQAGLFDITTKGVYDNLYLFPLGPSNSEQPSSPLLLSTNGTLYGTAEAGGANGVGSVYRFSTAFSPFISLVNVTSGDVGAQVGILGQGFSSKSVVKFGGTEATKTTLTGSTFILATVPTGALTGDVTVTTGSTVLSTLASYKVLPTYKSFTPSSGPVGTVVTFNGTGLTQTTKVTIDKISAGFTVVSDSEITITVPTGATSSKITVTTKGGAVTSSTEFTVN